MEITIVKKTELETKLNHQNIAAEQRKKYREYINELQIRINALSYLYEQFVGYRLWVYKDIILPKLIERTNHLIGYLMDRNIILSCACNTDSKNKLFIDWKVNCDNGRLSTIARSGGYVS